MRLWSKNTNFSKGVMFPELLKLTGSCQLRGQRISHCCRMIFMGHAAQKTKELPRY